MIELFIVLSLILINGLFALSELAIVSARQSRLKAMEAAGNLAARSALTLASNPGRFLSAVQIGITLIGLINGAYSGETFGAYAGGYLGQLGVPAAVASPLGYGAVIVFVTYLSVIVGELVPKNIALHRPETIACAVAPAMTLFSKVAAPAVWLLDASTRLVFRLFGQSGKRDVRVTDEEIKMLIAEAESAGVLESGERQMIAGVMRLADRLVVGLMTARVDVDWMDVNASEAEIRRHLAATMHSRIPVGDGSADNMLGVVNTRELFVALLSDQPFELRSHIRHAPVAPETAGALAVVAMLREAETPVALIHDEYGNFEGMVTPADILEAIAGVFRSDATGEEPNAVERDDGSWLISGTMPVDEMADRIGIPVPLKRGYETVAGLVLDQLGHIPRTGEQFEMANWRFEVIDLDRRRVDKVLVSRPASAPPDLP